MSLETPTKVMGLGSRVPVPSVMLSKRLTYQAGTACCVLAAHQRVVIYNILEYSITYIYIYRERERDI